MNGLKYMFSSLLSFWKSSNPLVTPRSLNPVQLADSERRNRNILLELSEEHGPIFGVCDTKEKTACVTQLPLARRLLIDHADSLRPVTLDLESLFPHGFMRQMNETIHKPYRKVLIDALNALDIISFSADLQKIAERELSLYAEQSNTNEETANEYQNALTRITTGFLVCLFFGTRPDDTRYDSLISLYTRLGPHGLVWNLRDQQVSAFNELRTALMDYAESQVMIGESDRPLSLLDAVVRQGKIDDTILGNLIYMVEMGRYDMKGLFRWLSYYAAMHPDWLQQLAEAETSDTNQAGVMAHAFVRETLRMDQSERLLREVTDDILFEGVNIPKGWRVRACLWEAHKDSSVFEKPFEFQPDRFLATRPAASVYSPFGLDHHQCPFSGIALFLAAVFLRRLGSNYRVASTTRRPSVRGGYHWEPPPDFSIILSSRSNH